MSADGASILVVGGGSRVAGELADLLGDAAVIVTRRSAGRRNELTVRDYDAVPDHVFQGKGCVVNCVGTSRGDIAHLHRLNATIPTLLASAAKHARVPRFIHISSFSVYGRERLIDRHTPPAPATEYGRSRLAGDLALLALSDDRFTTAVLRLPLIYALATPGKLGALMRLWARTRLIPIPAGDVARSMISVRLAAEIIVGLIRSDRSGIVLAADPQPFTYRNAARARAGSLHCLPLPRWLTDRIEHIAPEVGGRLFADSLLAEADNQAVADGAVSRLYADIAALPVR